MAAAPARPAVVADIPAVAVAAVAVLPAAVPPAVVEADPPAVPAVVDN